MYYLWKRSDGHVGASTFMPQPLIGADGKTSTFTKLAEAETWAQMEKKIVERQK